MLFIGFRTTYGAAESAPTYSRGTIEHQGSYRRRTHRADQDRSPDIAGAAHAVCIDICWTEGECVEATCMPSIYSVPQVMKHAGNARDEVDLSEIEGKLVQSRAQALELAHKDPAMTAASALVRVPRWMCTVPLYSGLGSLSCGLSI